MRNYRIMNGADRNAGTGFVMGLETPYGDKQYTTGFPNGTEIKVYRLKGETKETVSITVSDLFKLLKERGANGGL